MRNLFFVSIFLLISVISKAQSITENWIPISIENDKELFINIAGLLNYTGEEISIWSLQEMNPPISMEEVGGNIFKIKTEYLINKKLLRYSITHIIFFDAKDNIIKQYKYEHNSAMPEFKFNYPITKNSDVDKILSKCNDVINSTKEN